ncbi:unnamed protein product [Linum trigynum]
MLLLLAAHFPSGSAAAAAGPDDVCGPDRPYLHVSEFPGYVVNALNYVVNNAAAGYANPAQAQTTDVECSTFYPDATHGNAWAGATCYAGVTPGGCTECLSVLLPHVLPCKRRTLGGAYIPGRCWLRFGQYMPAA